MRFVETPVFTKRARELLQDEEYRALQVAGSNRSRGVQVRKRDFDDLVKSVRQAGKIRRKRMRPSRVTTFKPADIRAIRASLGKSQAAFAMMIGVSVATLRNWEQGRRVPDGPAQALLRIAAQNPEAVAAALSA
jgi:putative transcriptional regulator